MDTVSIVMKVNSTVPGIVAITNPLVVTCVTVESGSKYMNVGGTP